MEAKAYLKYVRITPRKMAIVCDLIRGKSAQEAAAILKNVRKSSCEPLLKLLTSCRANAENNFDMDPERLYVSQIFVCPGPTYKRIHARARGRAARVEKRTSHVTMVLTEKE